MLYAKLVSPTSVKEYLKSESGAPVVMARKVDEEAKRHRRVIIFSLIMIFLMVFSVASVVVYNDDSANRMQYGDYEFQFKDLGGGNGVLTLQMNGREVEFQNLPVQVAYIAMDPQVPYLMRSAQQVILTTDSNNTEFHLQNVDYARLQLALAIQKTANAYTQVSDAGLPIITCDDATPQNIVLYFNQSNTTAVTVDGSCIIVNAESTDILRVKDRIIFEYFGILVDGVAAE